MPGRPNSLYTFPAIPLTPGKPRHRVSRPPPEPPVAAAGRGAIAAGPRPQSRSRREDEDATGTRNRVLPVQTSIELSRQRAGQLAAVAAGPAGSDVGGQAHALVAHLEPQFTPCPRRQ